MDYYFLQIGSKGTDDRSIFYGACLPSTCSAKVIKTTINTLLDKVNFPLNVNYI